MLANGVKVTSSTAGSGALTIAAVAGSVALSQAFVIGQLFAYSIYTGGDSAPVFREAGIGYLSASSTLVRAKVSATFDGTTYNPISPTTTDFGGAAITVICTPHAATTESMAATVDTVSSSVMRYVTTANRALGTTTQAVASLRLYYIPFLLRVASPIASLAVNVTVAGAAGVTARLGIYVCTEKGYMGNLLAQTSDIDMSSTGLKAGTFGAPIMLPPGWYFVAVVCSGAVTLTSHAAAATNMIGGSPLGFANTMGPIDFRYEALASTALPAVAGMVTTLSAGSTHYPMVFMGIQ